MTADTNDMARISPADLAEELKRTSEDMAFLSPIDEIIDEAQDHIECVPITAAQRRRQKVKIKSAGGQSLFKTSIFLLFHRQFGTDEKDAIVPLRSATAD